MKDDRGSAILEYLIAGTIFFSVIFGVPLLIHGVQDYLALANAERLAMHQIEVNGYYGGCAQTRLQEALAAENLPSNLVKVANATNTQQQYGSPVALALTYTYSPVSWIKIPLAVGNTGISQYVPGEIGSGGCPPAANLVSATGPSSSAHVSIYATPNPANTGQTVTFMGTVTDQYGNPVPNGTQVVISGGQSTTVTTSGGTFSGTLTFPGAGTYTVTATAGGVSATVQETVISQPTVLFDQTVNYQVSGNVIPNFTPTANQAVVLWIDNVVWSPSSSNYDTAKITDVSSTLKPYAYLGSWVSGYTTAQGSEYAIASGYPPYDSLGSYSGEWFGKVDPLTISLVPQQGKIVGYYALGDVSAANAAQGVGMYSLGAYNLYGAQVGDSFSFNLSDAWAPGFSWHVKLELVPVN